MLGVFVQVCFICTVGIFPAGITSQRSTSNQNYGVLQQPLPGTVSGNSRGNNMQQAQTSISSPCMNRYQTYPTFQLPCAFSTNGNQQQAQIGNNVGQGSDNTDDYDELVDQFMKANHEGPVLPPPPQRPAPRRTTRRPTTGGAFMPQRPTGLRPPNQFQSVQNQNRPSVSESDLDNQELSDAPRPATFSGANVQRPQSQGPIVPVTIQDSTFITDDNQLDQSQSNPLTPQQPGVHLGGHTRPWGGRPGNNLAELFGGLTSDAVAVTKDVVAYGISAAAWLLFRPQ